jgi:endonuclease YncB( thermonuclease family)
MIKIAIVIALILILILLIRHFPYEVINNHDGDTSTLKPIFGKKFNVRFAVVDANELKQQGGREAKEYLDRIMPVGCRVSLVCTSEKGSYNREKIAIIYRWWTDVNLEMLKAGHAVIDPRYIQNIPPSMQSQYTKAQEHAKYWRLGRWGNPKHCALNPWGFRENCKNKITR